MFNNAKKFNQPLNTSNNSWNTSNVQNMNNMFNSAIIFNQDITGWNTSSVTNMSKMFNNATAFNQKIEVWSVGETTNLNEMFFNAYSMQQNTIYTSESTFNINRGTPTYEFFNQSSPYCVLAGTIITTDQEEIIIEKLNNNHTINNIKILGISKDFYMREELVLIKKNAISENVPSDDLYITPNNQLKYKN